MYESLLIRASSYVSFSRQRYYESPIKKKRNFEDNFNNLSDIRLTSNMEKEGEVEKFSLVPSFSFGLHNCTTGYNNHPFTTCG